MVNKILVNNNDSNYTHSIFDISEYTGQQYSTLSDALNAIPQEKHKGGMTIRYVPTDDNNYVQFRYMSSSIAVADFTNVANWQGVDSTITSGSKNLITSGGVNNVVLSIIRRLVPNYTQSLQWYYGGGIDTSNGNIITGGNFATWYYIKDYVPVKSSTVYGNIAIGAFYDKDKNFISGIQQATGTITSPSNAAFIRFCYTHPESFKFFEGTAPDFDNNSDIRRLIREIPIAENLDFHVGADYDYTTFSSAVAAAKNVASGVPTIHVHSGTYNLITENQAAANAGQHLVMLDKSVNIVFDKNAKLTANFDSSYQYYKECSPIFIIGNADVCIEGMNIECSNSLYCVHDESYGDYVYTHKFINCVMSMTQEHSDGMVHCIGGGLGRFCKIEIVGGSYNSVTPGWDLEDAKKVAISYHNGVHNSDNQSVIYIKDVYLPGKCRFSFSHCGESQLMTNVYISNCSVGTATTLGGQSGAYYHYDNMQLFEWNVVVRI